MVTIEQMRAAGQHAIEVEEVESEALPWQFAGTVFRCAWEYPVHDFEAEVGFYLDVLGFSTIALDSEYALFTTPGQDLTFACRRDEHASRDYTGHILCFMTKDIGRFAEALEMRIGAGAVTRVTGSPVQTVLRMKSPAGLQVDIWEDPS